MVDLGETSDPTVLVPGSPGELSSAAGRFGDFARLLEQTGDGLAHARVPGWTGSSADAFYASAARDATRLAHLGDASRATAQAVNQVADTTRWAQGEAREAIALWNSAASDDADDGSDSSGSQEYRHGSSSRQSGRGSDHSSSSGASDSQGGQGEGEVGAAARTRARYVLRRARLQLLGVRRDATAAVTEHTHTATVKALPNATTAKEVPKPAPHPAAPRPAAAVTAPAAAPHGRFIGPVATHPAAAPATNGDGATPPTTNHPTPTPAAEGAPNGRGPLSAAVPPQRWDGRLPIPPTTAPTTTPAAASETGEDRNASGNSGSGLDGSGSGQWVAGLPGKDPRHVRHVVVALPVHGHHDTLWDVAQRSVGDGRRWREIAALNQGLSQPDGRALHDPGFVRPGWVLAVPTAPASVSLGGASGGSALDQIPGTGPGGLSGPSVWSSGPGRAVDDGRGNFLPYLLGGAAVAGGVGLVVAGARHRSTPPNPHPGPTMPEPGSVYQEPFGQNIQQALQDRGPSPRRDVAPERDLVPDRPVRAAPSKRYPLGGEERPSAGTPSAWIPVRPADVSGAPPRSPVTAHEHGGADQLGAGDAWADAASPHQTIAPSAAGSAPHATPTGQAGPGASALAVASRGRWVIPIGIRGAATRTLELSRQEGFGLVGPGSDAAARALLALLLDPTAADHPVPGLDATATDIGGNEAGDGAGSNVQVWMTAGIARRLAGRDPDMDQWPERVRIHPNLPHLLAHLEAELNRRYRLAATSSAALKPSDHSGQLGLAGALGPVLLLAEPTEADTSRLRGVLAQGCELGVGGVLLGDWPSGTTCQLAIDATVLAARSSAALCAGHLP